MSRITPTSATSVSAFRRSQAVTCPEVTTLTIQGEGLGEREVYVCAGVHTGLMLFYICVYLKKILLNVSYGYAQYFYQAFLKSSLCLCLPSNFLSPASYSFNTLRYFPSNWNCIHALLLFKFLFQCKVLSVNTSLWRVLPQMHPSPTAPLRHAVLGLLACLLSLLHNNGCSTSNAWSVSKNLQSIT